MRIAVLGPLEVLGDDDAPVAVPGAKERLLLAVLAADAGRVVSADRIVEALWNGDPPPSARKSLQAHLVRLRTALEPDRPRGSTGRHVVRRGPGYALAVDEESLDSLRFGRLTALGRAQLGSGRVEEAVGLLTEAVELWRGEPYADWPDADFAVAERRRLAEVRGGAVVALLEARLAAGAHVAVVPEIERLVAQEPLNEDWWRLLMLALYRSGRQADALAAGRRARAVLAEELGADPAPALREVESAILAQDPALDRASTAVRSVPQLQRPSAAATGACPYKGLAAYQVGDAALFRGRRRLVSALVAALVDAPLLVVSGPSGAGKSSVVRAGLVPALAAGALPGSGAWQPLLLTPGSRPVDALAPLTGDAPPSSPVLLVCDQLEEVWGPEVEPAERTAFLDSVLGLVDDGVVVRAVLVLRGDHVGRLAEHSALAERVGGALVLVPALTDPELREVVREPARAVGLDVEPELLDAVVADGLGRVGALPLLSTALVGTWQQRSGDLLTLAGYLRSGGVAGALARSAEAAYEALDEDERGTARRLLVRLADVDEGGSLVRRRVPLVELELGGDGGERRRAVVEAFVGRRLLSIDAERLEVTHEALLTSWPRLARWLDEDAAGRAVRRSLAPAAQEWAATGRPDEGLYAGAKLAAALEWAERPDAAPTPVERGFLDASRRRAERELREARERAEREAAARRRTRRLAAALAVVLVSALVAAGLAVRSADQARDASLRGDAARLAGLAATTDAVDLALLLAVQAVRLADLPETRASLFSSVVGSGRLIRVATAPATVNGLMSGPEEVVFVDAGQGELLTWPDPDAGFAVSPDPEGDWFVSLDASPREPLVVGYGLDKAGSPWLGIRSPDGPVRPLASGEELGGIPTAASFTPDGARVLVVLGEPQESAEHPTATWRVVEFDVVDGSRRDVGPRRVAPPYSTGFDVDETGRWVVVGGSGPSVSADLAEVADGRVVSLQVPDKDVRMSRLVALPTGAAQVWADGEVTLYGPDGRPRQTLDAATRRVTDVVVAPGGTWAATVGSSGSVVLWDVDPATGLWTLREEVVGHAGDVVDAEVAADGDRLLTAGQDRRVAVWDTTVDGGFGTPVPALQERTLLGPAQVVEPERVAVAPTAPATARYPEQLASSAPPVPVAATFFDPVTGRVLEDVPIGTVEPGGWPRPSVSVSPDGSMVAATTGPVVTVLDSADRRRIGAHLPPPLLDPVDPAGPRIPGVSTCTGWTRDARVVVCVQDADGFAVAAVDPRSGDVVRSTPVAVPVTATATSPDGRLLAVTGSGEGLVVLLDAETLDIHQTVHAAGITQPAHVSWSPDGRRLAVSGTGGLILVDTSSWRPVAAPPPLTAEVLQTEWFPDSRTAAVAGRHRTTYLYDVEQEQVRLLVLPAAGAGTTEDGSVTLLPGIAEHLVVLGGSLPGRRYPLDPAAWSARACAVVGRDLTPAEWSRVLPNREHERTCGDRA